MLIEDILIIQILLLLSCDHDFAIHSKEEIKYVLFLNT